MTADIESLCCDTLGYFSLSQFHDRITRSNSVLTIIATVKNYLVGFKFGYGIESDTFYTWLGGVRPEYHRNGLGSEMIRKQIEWCRQKGFIKIRTETRNKWSEMLGLDLKYGF
ncbi:MAG: GNAT family N-acetyltransferase [Ignavibacteriaceae bacterium]